MYDFENDRVMSLSDVSERLPRGKNGRKVAISTIYRWIFRGVRGTRLRSVRIGGRRYITERALSDFLSAAERVDTERRNPDVPARPPSAGQVERALDVEGL
jgi:hypothetical protein